MLQLLYLTLPSCAGDIQAVQDLLPSRLCICKLLLQIIMLVLQHCQMIVQTPNLPA